MPNPVVHFEIIGRDARRLQDFYSSVFGWKIDASNPMNYGVVDNQGEGIGGGIAAGQPGDAPHTSFYIEVDDPETYLGKVEAMGGKTVMPTSEVMQGVVIAMFTDPEGNVVGLVKAEQAPA